MTHFREDTYSIIRTGDGGQHATTFTWTPTNEEVEIRFIEDLDILVNWREPGTSSVHLVCNAPYIDWDRACDEHNRLAQVLPDGSILLTVLGAKYLSQDFLSLADKVTMQ